MATKGKATEIQCTLKRVYKKKKIPLKNSQHFLPFGLLCQDGGKFNLKGETEMVL